MLELMDYFGTHHAKDGKKNAVPYNISKGDILDVPIPEASRVSEGEIEQLLEPLNKAGKSYVYTSEDLQEIRTQADEAAIAYLNSINRTADVAAREEHNGNLLTDLVSDTDLILELIKDETYSLYPEWTGTQERVENDIRYIYQTEYNEALRQIIYSKILFDTNEIVEQQVIDIQLCLPGIVLFCFTV